MTTWTPHRIYLLEEAQRFLVVAILKTTMVINGVPEDSPQRDALIGVNEHLAGALEGLQQVLDHAGAAREFTEAVEAFAQRD